MPRELKNIEQEDHYHIYNHTLAQILVEYASAVYVSDLTELFTWTCSRCNGMTKGFEMVELIVDVQNCLQSFVGCCSYDLNAIVMPLLEALKKREMPGAMVHHGFYSAYHNTSLSPGILKAVQEGQEEMYMEISRSWSVSGNSVLDHLTYYGTKLQADTSGSCKIVMSKDMAHYQTHAAGSVVLSRKPISQSILKQRPEEDGGIISL
ncbi:hypothetical protein J5N97_013107 [Dioscorea zingiberensis]|uniref:Uncharacterized protein n=1 Tax=Dioscorea zingiberensis TaxID=325984 RepID=A0A9D5CSV4_9LILI|nr:hypothetical protein J5N97_013107 [Dioscorea zingiberensis]